MQNCHWAKNMHRLYGYLNGYYTGSVFIQSITLGWVGRGVFSLKKVIFLTFHINTNVKNKLFLVGGGVDKRQKKVKLKKKIREFLS